MHNRVRLVVGSFLTKDLGIDWRAGERWFMRRLVDGDEANNNGNWQWIASVGTDPQPAYRRIYNPTRHQERYDPDGEYVRRYVPSCATCRASSWPSRGGCPPTCSARRVHDRPRLPRADRRPRRGAARGARPLRRRRQVGDSAVHQRHDVGGVGRGRAARRRARVRSSGSIRAASSAARRGHAANGGRLDRPHRLEPARRVRDPASAVSSQAVSATLSRSPSQISAHSRPSGASPGSGSSQTPRARTRGRSKSASAIASSAVRASSRQRRSEARKNARAGRRRTAAGGRRARRSRPRWRARGRSARVWAGPGRERRLRAP